MNTTQFINSSVLISTQINTKSNTTETLLDISHTTKKLIPPETNYSNSNNQTDTSLSRRNITALIEKELKHNQKRQLNSIKKRNTRNISTKIKPVFTKKNSNQENNIKSHSVSNRTKTPIEALTPTNSPLIFTPQINKSSSVSLTGLVTLGLLASRGVMAGNTQAGGSNNTSLSNTSLSLAANLIANMTFPLPELLNTSAVIGNTSINPSALLQITTTSPQRSLTTRLQDHLASWYQGLVNTTNYLTGIKASIPNPTNSPRLSNTERVGIEIDVGSDAQRARISRSLDQPADPQPEPAVDPEVDEAIGQLDQVLEEIRLDLVEGDLLPDVFQPELPDIVGDLESRERQIEAELAAYVAQVEAQSAQRAAQAAREAELAAETVRINELPLAERIVAIEAYMRRLVTDAIGRVPTGAEGEDFTQRLAQARGRDYPSALQQIREIEEMNRDLEQAVDELLPPVREELGPLPDVADTPEQDRLTDMFYRGWMPRRDGYPPFPRGNNVQAAADILNPDNPAADVEPEEVAAIEKPGPLPDVADTFEQSNLADMFKKGLLPGRGFPPFPRGASKAAADILGPVKPPAADPLPADPAPVDPAPVDPAPVDPAAADPAAVDPLPADPAAADPLPADPAAADPLPADPAAVDPLPAEPAPIEPAPIELPPVEPVAVELAADMAVAGAAAGEGAELGGAALGSAAVVGVGVGVASTLFQWD